MSVNIQQILDSFPDLLTHIAGDTGTELSGPCAQENPQKSGIAYTSDPEIANDLLKSNLGALVVAEKILDKIDKDSSKPTLLSSKNTYLSLAKVNGKFFQLPFLKQPFHDAQIHSTAVIHESAKIHKTVVVSPGVVIYENVEIGANSFIGANSVIEANTTIGDNAFIHPQVYIGHTVNIGNNVSIKPHSTVGSDGFGFAQDEKRTSYQIPHYGELIIEDDVHIGANVNIDRGTFEKALIKRCTKIDNHCHLAHNIEVGEDCLITAGFISAGSAKMGNRVTTAGRVSLNGRTHICDDVMVGPHSAVSNHIKKPGIYAGFPPIPMKDFLKSSASLASLPKMRRQITKILKHLGIDE